MKPIIDISYRKNRMIWTFAATNIHLKLRPHGVTVKSFSFTKSLNSQSNVLVQYFEKRLPVSFRNSFSARISESVRKIVGCSQTHNENKNIKQNEEYSLYLLMP